MQSAQLPLLLDVYYVASYMNVRLLSSIFLSAAVVSADTLILRNSSRVDGSYLGGDNRSIRFAAGNQVTTYSLNDVTSILFNQSAADSGVPQSNSPAPVNSAPVPMNGPAINAAANGDVSGSQVPAGTELVIRLIDPVNSDTDRLGQTYRASLDQPVAVNGQTVIQRGTDAVATLINSQKSGKFAGKTVMTLDLKSVTVNGRPYEIVTTGVSQTSNSRGERSAKVIGGTAALGAIIGAIAGGGKGAAVGTLAGAGAGTAAEVATSGQKVKVPAETRLTFTLQNPLTL